MWHELIFNCGENLRSEGGFCDDGYCGAANLFTWCFQFCYKWCYRVLLFNFTPERTVVDMKKKQREGTSELWKFLFGGDKNESTGNPNPDLTLTRTLNLNLNLNITLAITLTVTLIGS